MNDEKVKELALHTATESVCQKRKVGAVIVDANCKVLAAACNYSPTDECEDAAGATKSDVVHAEVAAIDWFNREVKCNRHLIWQNPLTIYTTHAPCANCRAAIEEAGIRGIIVVEDVFMKFDTDKLRYDLIPPEWTEGDAEILTFGAKKYKPNNWREVDDPGRYEAAMMRHFIAYLKGETHDPETGLHHMKHLRTNAGFLLTLSENKNEDNN